jgi:transposase
MQYSTKFKGKMIEKMTGRGARTANALAAEVGVSQGTLSRWLREAKIPSMPKEKKTDTTGRRRWSAEDRVRIVIESGALRDEDLGAFLRREGLHEADLARFRQEVEQAATEGLQAQGRRRGLSPEQKKLRVLEKELARKEKALAEAAALLVLRGKVQAFLAAEEEGDTNGNDER